MNTALQDNQTAGAIRRRGVAQCYARSLRNIYRIGGGYKVVLTRRPKNVYGGRFSRLKDAVSKRNEIEAAHVAGRPWSNTPERKVRRTIQQLRMERRAAGVCQSCGQEPPKAGCVTCQGCMDAMHIKRNAHNSVITDTVAKTGNVNALDKGT